MGSSYSVPEFAPLATLAIPDWRNQEQMVNISESKIISYFKTNTNKSELTFSLGGLKYLDNEADLNAERLQLKFNHAIKQEFQLNMIKEPLELFSKWRSEHYYKINYFNASEFITTVNTLALIMNAQFDLKKQDNSPNWKISAKMEGNNIYLWQENDNKFTESMAKYKELFKRHLFVKKPENIYRNLNSVFSEIFYEIYEKNIGEHRLLFLAETPGVNSDQLIKNLEQLQTVPHLYLDIFENQDFPEDIINYNPFWWCKSKLTNAENCFLVRYNRETDRIQEIINFNLDKFNDLTNFENIWSPKAAWNFLELFLTFVKNEVNKVKSDYKDKCIWEFERNNNSISCKIHLKEVWFGSIYYLPLPQDCFV